MLKTKDEIVKDLINDTIAQPQNKITYFGRDSVIRAIYTAISGVIYEIWSDLFQIKRQIQLQTAEGEDLDEIARRHGVTRRGATKSSVPVIIEGVSGTLIPAGTIFTASTRGINFLSLYDITLGNNNPLERPFESNLLGDVVLCESVKEGSGSKVYPYEIDTINFPQSELISKVKNIISSSGGEDIESDDELRQRIYESNDKLAQGTLGFYEAITKEANPNVLRCKAKFNPLIYGIDLYVLSNSLGLFNNSELQAIADYVYNKQRALTPVRCFNANLVPIDIEANITIKNNYTFNQIYNNIVLALSEYFNLKQKEFGTTIKYYEIENIMQRAEGVQSLTQMTVNNSKVDIKIGQYDLPRLNLVTIHDFNNDKQIQLEYNYMIL